MSWEEFTKIKLSEIQFISLKSNYQLYLECILLDQIAGNFLHFYLNTCFQNPSALRS